MIQQIIYFKKAQKKWVGIVINFLNTYLAEKSPSLERISMNHREEPLSQQMRKRMVKEIRSAKETKGDAPLVRNLRGQNLARTPKKEITEQLARIRGGKKRVAIAKKKNLSPHSKRSSPGTVDGTPSMPAYSHREGKRWIKTLRKQVANSTCIETLKSAKRSKR